MKKMFIVMFVFITLLTITTACTEIIENSDEIASNIPIEASKEDGEEKLIQEVMTQEDVKNDITYGEVIKIDEISKQYILTTSYGNANVKIYAVYDLFTGKSEQLPTLPNYAELLKIESENLITFKITGMNTESPITELPAIIHCVKIADDDSTHHYTVIYESIEHPVYDRVTTGSKKECNLFASKLTYDGLQIKFIPIEGKESIFSAAAYDLPPIEISCDEGGTLLYFDIQVEQYNQFAFDDLNYIHNEYIDNIKFEKLDDAFRAIIDITDQVESYNLRKKNIEAGVIFEINFN